jgi:predicted nucleic acid-binding protein
VSDVVADTSVWVELFAGRPAPGLVEALRQGSVVLPPIVVAELISGVRRARDRTAIQSLVAELPVHETPLDHWVRVGDLRRRLAEQGLSVSTPDAHVAQCALERRALLLSRDAVFGRIAKVSDLEVRPG